MHKKKHELIKGGCGRSEEDMACTATGLWLAIIAGAIVLIAMVIEELIYG
jgi:hypothetical protein